MYFSAFRITYVPTFWRYCRNNRRKIFSQSSWLHYEIDPIKNVQKSAI